MKDFFKNSLVSLAAVLVIFSIFEISLRFFWKMSALEGEVYTASKNYNLRYELIPKAESAGVAINADGFRDRQFPLIKNKLTTRIIMLGDSEAMGKVLKLEDTIVKKLEAALIGKCPHGAFEVMNMGVDGYNTAQEYEFFKTKGLKYHPDVVILYYSFNDPDYPEYYFAKNFFNRHFISFRYVQYRIKKFLVKRDRKLKRIVSEEENYRYLYNSSSWSHAQEALLAIRDLTAEHKIKFVLALVLETSSMVLDFNDGYPYLYINDEISDFCRRNDINIIDPLAYIRQGNYNPRDLIINAGDWHKNAKANEILSSYIADELIKRGIVFCGQR